MASILLSPQSLADVFTLVLVSLHSQRGYFVSLLQAGKREGAKGKSKPKSIYQQKVCYHISHWPALCHMVITEAEKYAF